MTIIDKTVFLAAGEGPEPAWRDEAEDAATWPAAATFKLVFTQQDCGYGTSKELQARLPVTEFYGADGWPVDFPQERKPRLADQIKRELQAFPRHWRGWNKWTWSSAEQFPDSWARARGACAVLQPLVDLTSR